MIKIITSNDLTEEIVDIFDDSIKENNNPFNKYLGYYNDKLIGFINYSFIYDRCEINYIGVLKEYRNNNVASNLLKYLINSLKNCKNITLEVNVNNKAAINLYKKFNFEIVTIRKNYYGVDNAYLMIKKLGD